jgi:hypothetical protein
MNDSTSPVIAGAPGLLVDWVVESVVVLLIFSSSCAPP